MAADKKKSKTELARLMPNSELVTIDGKEIRVAMDKTENTVHNMVLAAQMRSLLQEQIKKYQEDDIKFTPKEIKELTEAAKNIAQFSGEIYQGSDPLKDGSGEGLKKVDRSSEEVVVSYDSITEQKKE